MTFMDLLRLIFGVPQGTSEDQPTEEVIEPVKEEPKLSGFKLSQASLNNLEGVHPDLVKVVKRAIEITEQDFKVIEGMRTRERQAELFGQRKTTTMNSRHLTGHAVDIAPWPISWDWNKFYPIADAMKEAARELDIPLEWGGDWKSFPDGPHWQLPWSDYGV